MLSENEKSLEVTVVNKKKKDTLKEIIKKGVEKEIEKHDRLSISDEEMISSGQSLPPDEILEKIIKEAKNENK